MKDRLKIKNIAICIIAVLLFNVSVYIICKYGFKYDIVFSKTRLVVFGFISVFIVINFIFDYRRIWYLIFKYRYIIGILVFFILVMLGIHMYSLNDYNIVVQPNHYIKTAEPFWGINRSIRSDEFLSNTPVVLSQALLGSFDDINPNVMAANGAVLMFPKASTFNISILGAPCYWGFLFLNIESGYSFYSLFPIFLAFFATFEFFLIFTDKKILALTGTLLLIFSSEVLWFNCPNYFSYGFICCLLFNKLLTARTIWKKIFISMGLGWSASCYILLVYPAWQVPFFYLFIVLAIWIIYKNRKNINPKNFLYIPISIVVVLIITIPALVGSIDEINALSNTVYPGARNSTGGNYWEWLYLWTIAPFYGVKGSLNTCEYSQFLCFYPLPILLGIYQIVINIKKHKNDLLLILLVCFAIALNIWNYIPIGFVANITLLNMSTPQRSQIVVAVACILILLRWIDLYSTENFTKRKIVIAIILGLLISFISVSIANNITNDYSGKFLGIVFSIFFAFFILMIVLNNKKVNTILLSLLIGISLFTFVTVNPLSRGLSSIYNKPISSEIARLSNEDTNGVWISANSNLYQSNFALANGAKIINSVNFYPQMELWKKIDTNAKYEYIYNRFAHITIDLTNNETNFELLQPDSIKINLNINDLKLLNVNYIISSDKNISNLSNNNVQFKKLYDEDGSYIYKVS